MRPRAARLVTAVCLLLVIFRQSAPDQASPSKAAILATWPTGFVETRIVSGVSSPTSLDIASDGRIFFTQQSGEIYIVKNEQLLSTPFLDHPDVDWSGERGMLGMTLDPNFATNGHVYVYYSASVPSPHNRISRFTASGDRAVSGSEVVLMDLPAIGSAIWHMGGALHFGPDGKLYAAVGDHQIPNDAQLLTSPFGKILRINPDGSIPTDNPFYSQTAGVNRAIWAIGLRNPYTFNFQPGTGRMYINDVGNGSWEEVNEGAAGANFGWPATEGATTDPRFRTPVYAYSHSEGCSVVGGTFYNPTTAQFPSQYIGKYLVPEFCQGWLRTLDPATRAVASFGSGIPYPIDMDVSSNGTLFYLTRGVGAGGADGTGLGGIWKLQYTGSQAPQITTQPSSQTVFVGDRATFGVTAIGATSYQWQRNGVNIAGATAAGYTTPVTTLADSGSRYRVIVTNSFGSTTSAEVVLTVTNNQLPVPTISSPAASLTYRAGDSISFSGSASDAEDGALPASAFTWQVDFQHETHAHPFMSPRSGITSGSFTTMNTGEASANVYYRIYLTVRDSGGRTASTFRDIQPQKSTMSFATSPAGLKVTLDGNPLTTPSNVVGVVGMQRSLGVVSPQTLNGTVYEFVSWSDGGAATHTISTPASNTTYTASFRAIGTASYLSDRTPVSATNGWGPYERDRSNGEQAAGDGRTITLNGVTYAKGLGVHAASDLVYTLGGQCTHFTADIGVDDETGTGGTVAFQVFADGVQLYTSPIMNAASSTQFVSVNIAGRNQLRLVVTDGLDGNAMDHADWAGASLVCGGTTTTPTPTRTSTPTSGNLIPRTGWSLRYVDSQETVGENGAATNAFDGNTSTIWHTRWNGGINDPLPHEIQIDMGTSYNVSGLRYLPRQDGNGNGRIGQYEFYVSADGTSWGTAAASGTFANTGDLKEVTFASRTGRYIRLRALSEVNGTVFTSAAEIEALGTLAGGATATPTRTPTSGGSYAAWTTGVSYAIGARVSYGGRNYECLTAHTSQAGWEPPNVPSLWRDITGSTPVPSATATRTRTNTTSGPSATRTRTRTNTTSGPTATRTRTRTNTTSGPTATRTRTNTVTGPTATRTRTNTTSGPTATRTPTTSGTSPAWAPGVAYTVGTRVSYGGRTYECLQAHTSQVGWEPANTPALWRAL